jgi:putative DNA primase/helicase
MSGAREQTETTVLLARLRGVRAVSGGWLALCPNHADHRPSLSVAQGRRGVVLTCRAGCPTAAVIDAVGLTFRDLFFR